MLASAVPSWRDRGRGALSALRGKAAEYPFVDHEMILASLLEAVLVVSPDDAGEEYIAFVNPAAEVLLGSSGALLCGAATSEVFAQSPWIPELLRRLGTSDENDLRVEGRLVRADISRQVLAEVSSLRDQDGEDCGSVLCLRDVGRRASLSKQDEERHRLAELDRLVASLAHELNNPLSGIRGAAQILGRKLGSDSELLDYTEMIERQTDRMADLAKALMLLEAPAPQRRQLNIHQVLNEVLLLERSAAEQLGVRIVHAFDPSLPDFDGDYDQLQQLFLNIIKNAVTACSAKGGSVQVSTRMEHGFYVTRDSERLRFLAVEITDGGPGLDEDTLQHMFSPLFSRTEGGHGMGLAVAQSIASAHGGVIQAENGKDGGALLRVLLPVAAGPSQSESTRSRRPAGTPSHDETKPEEGGTADRKREASNSEDE